MNLDRCKLLPLVQKWGNTWGIFLVSPWAIVPHGQHLLGPPDNGMLPRGPTPIAAFAATATTAFSQTTLNGAPRGSCKETQACIPERPRRRTPCCLLQNCLMSAAWSPTIKQTPALCSSKKLPFVIPCLALLLHLLSFLLSHSFGTLWTPEARCSSHPCFLLSPKFGLPVQSFYLRIQCLPFL